MPFYAFYKLPCRILCDIAQHNVRGFGFFVYDIANRVSDQLFLEKEEKFHSFFVPASVNQAAADLVSEFFPGIAAADEL